MRQSYQQDYENEEEEDAFLRRGIRKEQQREENFDNQSRHHNPPMSRGVFQTDPSRHIKDRQGKTLKEDLLHKSRSGVFLNRNFYRMDKRFYNEEEVIENYSSNCDNNTSQILSDIFSKIAMEKSAPIEIEEQKQYPSRRSSKQNNLICIESPSSSPQHSPRRPTQFQNLAPLFIGKDNRSERTMPIENESYNQLSDTGTKNTQIRFIPQQNDTSNHRQAPQNGIQSTPWQINQEPLPFIPLPSFQPQIPLIPIMPIMASSEKIIPQPVQKTDEQKVQSSIIQVEKKQENNQIKPQKPMKKSYFKERQITYFKIKTISEKQLMQELTQICSTPHSSSQIS